MKTLRLPALSHCSLFAVTSAVLLAPAAAQAANCAGIEPPSGAPPPCYIAFIHGAGHYDVGSENIYSETYTDWDNLAFTARGASEDYFWPSYSSDPIDSFTFGASGQFWGASLACRVGRIRYDGRTDGFIQVAEQVAQELNNFYCAKVNEVDQSKVIIVAHSMGGLVARWILNQGANPQSGSYSESFANVVQNTKYAITVQTPHTGTKMADAIWGVAGSWDVNWLGGLAVFFGFIDRTDETLYMRRDVLEHWSAPGGVMGDDYRTRNIFTVGSDSVGADSHPAWGGASNEDADRDSKLQLIWNYVYDDEFPDDTGGDGLVPRYSAQGFNPGTGNWIPGPLWTWIDSKHNHNHGRYNLHSTDVWDRLNAFPAAPTENFRLGSYIGSYGMNLPWSAINHTISRN